MQAHLSHLESILDSITDGFFTLDREYNFTFVNKAFERLCGVKEKDILGVNYWEHFPKSKHQKFWTLYHKALDMQDTQHFEEFANSLQKWVYVNVYPTPEGLSVYFVDVTDAHNARMTINKQNRRLLEIAHMISNNARKPISNIKELAPRLNPDGDLHDNISVLRDIVDCCDELDKIINVIDDRTSVITSLPLNGSDKRP